MCSRGGREEDTLDLDMVGHLVSIDLHVGLEAAEVLVGGLVFPSLSTSKFEISDSCSAVVVELSKIMKELSDLSVDTKGQGGCCEGSSCCSESRYRYFLDAHNEAAAIGSFQRSVG